MEYIRPGGNEMMRRVCILIGLLLISGAASALTKSEVRKIIKDAYPGARITEIETETYRDQDVYEVDFRHDGKKLEAIISVDGEIIKVDIDD